jgi:predicted TIM-barrel fold metal-dependent hydrolase
MTFHKSNAVHVVAALALASTLSIAAPSRAQEIDPRIAAHLAAIQAVDDHSHVIAPDIEHDTGYDALPCDILGSGSSLPPANTRFGPGLQAAWEALYGVVADSDSPENLKRWQQRQRATREKLGDAYFDWVLRQAGIDVVLANRVARAPQLGPRHFQWVPYGDALLFPLDNTAAKSENPDRLALYGAEERLLKTYMSQVGVAALPSTLDAYLSQVAFATLDAQRKDGAVGLKFELAYLRSLDVEPASHDLAADVYARYAAGGVPEASAYRRLQDFLLREIAVRAGKLGMVVQIHTGIGCGEYFQTRGADPLLLETLVTDPAMRGTQVVLLHGGSPFDRHNLPLILKPNVWVDFSAMELLNSPPELARTLRPWLESMPEHVLFGTDAGPWGPGMGWEESTWIGARNARRALGIALTGMLRDRTITVARAKAIADRVLRSNAVELYRLK